MLVRLQNPTCGFYATEPDWVKRFERKLKEDARPMLILAPMHPVMLVYDLLNHEAAAGEEAARGERNSMILPQRTQRAQRR